jgi:hypothetical protein
MELAITFSLYLQYIYSVRLFYLHYLQSIYICMVHKNAMDTIENK